MGNPLNVLYEAVGWVLTRIYDVLSPALGPSSGWTWALTIIILVVLMRLIMVPLFIKQMHTTRAMSSLQPQMSALRKKYKNDKQTLNQETMKLYQEAGVNPLMGCLPVVAQLPVFFSLFSVLKAIADYSGGPTKYDLPIKMVRAAQHAKILGASIADKVLFTHGVHVPVHAKLVIICAVLVSMTTTYLTVRQSQKRGMMPAATPDNPMGQSQKYMAYIMPFFALTGLYWPFGLVLYWVTTNVWTLLQQFVLFKRYPYTPPSADDAALATAGTAGARALAPGAKAAPARSVTTRNTTVRNTNSRTTTKPGTRPTTARGNAPKPGTARAGAAKPAAASTDATTVADDASAAASGAAESTAAESTAATDSATQNRAAQNRAAQNRTATSGAAQNGAARAGSARSAAAKSTAAKGGTAKPSSARPGAAKPGAARPGAAGNGTAQNGAAKNGAAKDGAAKDGTSGSEPAATGGQNGAATAADSGAGAGSMLRRFGRKQAEPEPEPEAPITVVRQQPQRQSRSKRSGKR